MIEPMPPVISYGLCGIRVRLVAYGSAKGGIAYRKENPTDSVLRPYRAPK
jgi:hypothetical protein